MWAVLLTINKQQCTLCPVEIYQMLTASTFNVNSMNKLDLLFLVSLHFSPPLQNIGPGTGVVHWQFVWSAKLWQERTRTLVGIASFGGRLHSYLRYGHLGSTSASRLYTKLDVKFYLRVLSYTINVMRLSFDCRVTLTHVLNRVDVILDVRWPSQIASRPAITGQTRPRMSTFTTSPMNVILFVLIPLLPTQSTHDHPRGSDQNIVRGYTAQNESHTPDLLWCVAKFGAWSFSGKDDTGVRST